MHNVIAGTIRHGKCRIFAGCGYLVELRKEVNPAPPWRLTIFCRTGEIDLIKIKHRMGMKPRCCAACLALLIAARPWCSLSFRRGISESLARSSRGPFLKKPVSEGYEHSIIYDKYGYPISLTKLTDQKIRYVCSTILRGAEIRYGHTSG